MDDSPADIEAKLKRAVTDSGSEIRYDKANKPGISNLLEIYASFTGRPIPSVEKQFKGKTYSILKTDLARVISDHFAIFRKRKTTLLKNPSTLTKVLAVGSTKARRVADKKMTEVKKKVGLL